MLCPMNRGALGARTLNIELQKALNPNPTIKIERYGNTFAPGDKVMVTVNDYDKEVFNGDIGFIKQIDLDEQESIIDFDGRDVVFDLSELDIVSLAYATTVHKAQGSEYPAVIIPIATQHFMMLKRNLLYTGCDPRKKTRGPHRPEKGGSHRHQGEEPETSGGINLRAGQKNESVASDTPNSNQLWSFFNSFFIREPPFSTLSTDSSSDTLGRLFALSI